MAGTVTDSEQGSLITPQPLFPRGFGWPLSSPKTSPEATTPLSLHTRTSLTSHPHLPVLVLLDLGVAEFGVHLRWPHIVCTILSAPQEMQAERLSMSE